MILSKAQKRCGKRGHGFVANYETGEIISGCTYCGAFSGYPLGIAARSMHTHPLDTATRITVMLCLLALSGVAVVCALWLGAAL